ncbi:MAG TPA: hypothetical protein PLP42_08045, partial [Acidobacteriota bacterium]|nr:hypothetical protein [Acidobacteriota bacterium]
MLTGQAGGRLLGVIVLIYILCFGIFQSPKIFDYYRVSDDTRQQIYPLYLARDGQLFQDDLLTRYFRSHTPPFYYYAHYPLAWLIDPVILSKIMQFLLLGVVLRFLYLIGKLVYGPLLGWTLVFLTVHSPALVGLTDGGLPRGWAAPGTVVFVWAVLADRQRIALAAVLVSGLFYPPIFLVLGPSYAVWTLVRGKASRWDVVGLVLIILGFWPMVFRDPEIGRVVTLAEAELMPEWQVGSRFPFLPMPSLLSLFSRNFVTSYLPSPGHAFWTWLLVALGISALLWARPPLGAPRRLAAALGLPLGFSVVMFEVSRLMAFRLHIPDRNLKYTVPCLGMVLITIAVFEIVTRISCKWRPFR